MVGPFVEPLRCCVVRVFRIRCVAVPTSVELRVAQVRVQINSVDPLYVMFNRRLVVPDVRVRSVDIRQVVTFPVDLILLSPVLSV